MPVVRRSAGGGSPPSGGPVRMCIGCRRRSPRSEMLRVVMKGSAVIPDGRVRQPGRGGYLHYDLECLDAAVQRKAFARAFHTGVRLSYEDVSQVLQQAVSVEGSQSGDEMSSQ